MRHYAREVHAESIGDRQQRIVVGADTTA